MSGFNGTGPVGTGSMTGRGRGYCLSYVEPGSNVTPGAGRGGGRGRRVCLAAGNLTSRFEAKRGAFPTEAVYLPPVSGEKELDFLKMQLGSLEKALEQAMQRIKELES